MLPILGENWFVEKNEEKISSSKPLLKQSTHGMLMFQMKSTSWDHKLDASQYFPSPTFTMRRPPYIGLERPNHLRYLWGKLRILLLQLWIFPKIMAWPRIQIQLPSKIEGISSWFSSTSQNSLRKGSAPPKGAPEHYSAPLKGCTERQRFLSLYSGALLSKNIFWVDFPVAKGL